jgi:putative nucleotidyltransferase with HDIG domain
MNSLNRGLTAAAAYTPSGGYARARKWGRELAPSEARSLAWAALLLGAAMACAVVLKNAGYSLHPVWAVLVMGAMAAIAERSGVAVNDRVEMSASFLPIVFAAVALGPLAGFVAGAVSNAADFRRPLLRWVTYTPIRALTGGAAGMVAIWLGGGSGFGHYLLISSVAAIALIVVDAFFNSLTLTVRSGANVFSYPSAVLPIFALALPLYGPLIGLFVYGYHAYSLLVAVVFFVPALALQRLIHLYQQEKEASRHLAAANSRLRTANVRFATGLVAMLEESDPYTAGHSLAVATYSLDIAKRMALPEDDCDLVYLCALVHDIGKYRLPTSLLEKAGPLNLDERRLMEKHPEYGEQLLHKIEVEDSGRIGLIVRHHHERVDGNGYPDGLTEDQIPLLSKIITAADSYNAMTSRRPYRDALPSQVARLRLAQAVGSQFDTAVVAAFEAILTSSDEDYRTAVGSRFVFDRGNPVGGDSSPVFVAAHGTS